MTKTKTGTDGGKKLASDAGREKQKSGGEPRKGASVPRGTQRTGSSKQRKG